MSSSLSHMFFFVVLQGFSFLWRYVEFRGHCQESLYNLGRALHQLGLTHLALHYYEKALTLPSLHLEVRHLYDPPHRLLGAIYMMFGTENWIFKQFWGLENANFLSASFFCISCSIEECVLCFSTK